MKSAAEFWDAAAEKYARSAIADEDAYRATLERTRTHLSAEDRVLEVGCGTGSTALLLAGDVQHIMASDISGQMIKIAQAKAHDQSISNVEFVQADLFDVPLEGAPYDAVLALNLLHLVEDVPAAVRRIHGYLKPGGTFISKTVCSGGKGGSLKFRAMKTILPLMQFFGKAPYVGFMDGVVLEDLMRSEGFEILEASDTPPPSRYIVARKAGA